MELIASLRAAAKRCGWIGQDVLVAWAQGLATTARNPTPRRVRQSAL